MHQRSAQPIDKTPVIMHLSSLLLTTNNNKERGQLFIPAGLGAGAAF